MGKIMSEILYLIRIFFIFMCSSLQNTNINNFTGDVISVSKKVVILIPSGGGT